MGWLRAPRMTEAELAKRGAHLAGQLARSDPLWPGQLATVAALLLYFFLPEKLSIGPGWPVPTFELLALGALVVVTRRREPAMAGRVVAVVIVLVAILANMVALGLLVHYLLKGGHAKGTNLISGGVVIWVTNLLLFTVVYWELDRGGPLGSVLEGRHVLPDFLYPQMSDDAHPYAPHDWKPNFLDYFYVSLTNQAAFSPTDAMPLTLRAKLLMGVQGTASLVTIGIIISRAVNILS
jgi:hypothetical protein